MARAAYLTGCDPPFRYDDSVLRPSPDRHRHTTAQGSAAQARPWCCFYRSCYRVCEDRATRTGEPLEGYMGPHG